MPDERKYVPETLNFEDDMAGSLQTLSTNFDELGTGYLDNVVVTVITAHIHQGEGQTIETRNGSRPDSDQLVYECRIENADEVGTEEEFLPLRFKLPKLFTPRDGSPARRNAPAQNTYYGQFLARLETLGISGNPERAKLFHMLGPADLIGIRLRLRNTAQKNEINGELVEWTWKFPTDIYEWDNAEREKFGLPHIVADPAIEGKYKFDLSTVPSANGSGASAEEPEPVAAGSGRGRNSSS